MAQSTTQPHRRLLGHFKRWRQLPIGLLYICQQTLDQSTSQQVLKLGTLIPLVLAAHSVSGQVGSPAKGPFTQKIQDRPTRECASGLGEERH